jgi:taurine dioxygenase
MTLPTPSGNGAAAAASKEKSAMTYEYISQKALPAYENFAVRPASGALGGYVDGVDLAADLEPAVVAELREALLEFKVLFFRRQPLNEERHLAFARRFGMPQGPGAIPPLDGYPMIRKQQYDQSSRIGSDVNYHADDTFRTYPSKFSILRGIRMPVAGGDTIWVDMEKAYDALSAPMKAFIDGLSCEHNLLKSFGMGILKQYGAKAVEDMMKRNPPAVHPLVRVHPETGRRCIYANQLLASHIVELKPQESDNLLQFLFQHSYQPEFQCRFSWENDSVAMWDNRCTQHRGINDFYPAFRLMHRIPLVDDQRPSQHPEQERILEFGDVEFVRTEELFDTKPELAYPDQARG